MQFWAGHKRVTTGRPTSDSVPNMELISSLTVPGLPGHEQDDFEVILYDIDDDQLANLRFRGICVTLNTECPGT